MRIKRPHAATIRVFAIAITAVMCTLVILSAAFPIYSSIDSQGFLAIGLSQIAAEVQADVGGGGSPAYQVLVPNEIGSETGLQVFPPKLQDGGEKDNWLAVQSPDGLDVPVGTPILDEDGDQIGNNASIGGIYINPSNVLIIGTYNLSNKCPKPIEISTYTLYGNVTEWSDLKGKNVTSPLRAKFRSYVFGSGQDTYQLEDCPQRYDSRSLPVVSVTVYAKVRGTVAKSSAATRLNIATKKYDGNVVTLGISNDTLISTTYILNPNTGVAWTWAELDGLEAGVTLKDSAECSYVHVQVKTEVHSQTFYPITPVDVTGSTSDAWTDIDCSSYIASGATGVILHWVNTLAASFLVGDRKNGSTDDRKQQMIDNSHTWTFIGVDASRIFEAYNDNTGFMKLYLVGYTMTGVTAFTNAYDKSLGGTASWTDINCATEAPSAIGLTFEVRGVTANYGMGLRKNGSTDPRTSTVYGYSCMGAIIGCDGSQLCEGYIDNTNVDFWLVGYITDGCTFNTNATDLSLGSTGAWTDLSALPSSANMGFIEVASSGLYSYGLRKNGSSEDIYKRTMNHSWGIVECDGSYIIEGKIADTGVDFFLVGYSTTTTIIAPTVTTQAATDVLSTSCTGNGNITATGGENCSTRGFCYMVGTSGDPTTANSTAYDTGSFGVGTYTKSITGLSPGTGYRVRAYAINSGGTGYGTTVQVTTPCSPSISNTPSTWNVHSGIVVPVSSQYTTGLGYFNLTNTNSGGAVTVTIHGHDMTGGNTWTLSDTAAPASMTYGLKASTDAKTLYEYYNAGDDDHYGFYSQYWIGQSFNSSTSHTITGVKLKLWRGLEDLPGTITISIRATDGSGLPTGSDLAVGTTNGNTLPESSPGEWREITFDNCYTLSASTEYSIIGRCEAYSAFWRLDKTSPSYSGGCLVESNNSGSSWVNNATYDLMFEEYGGSFSTIVKKSETYNTLVASLANNASQLWGLLMYTPTVYTDGVPKSGNITLTVVCT